MTQSVLLVAGTALLLDHEVGSIHCRSKETGPFVGLNQRKVRSHQTRH